MKNKYIVNAEWDSIFNENKENNFSNHAFPLFLFTERLYNELEKNNIKNVLFMSREGQFLKKLFDKYCEIRKEEKLNVADIKTHYFYGSRNSIMTASNKPIEEENFESLLKFFHFFMSPAQFLFSIGFDKDQIEIVRKELGKKIDKKCFDLKSSKILKKLLQNAKFRELYENNRSNQAESLRAYFKSFNIDEKEGYTFVDIGYHGTMQDLIFKFFNNKVSLRGYFIKCRAENETNNLKSGLLSDTYNKKLFGHRINKYDAFNYEQILRADHGRCTGYKLDKNGNGVPTIDKHLGDDKIYEKYVKKMQDDIYDKFVKIAHKKISDNDDISAICIIYYYYLVKYKTKADYKWIIDMQDVHHDDFGYVGYPGKAFARWLRKFAFKSKDRLFVINNRMYINSLRKNITKK